MVGFEATEFEFPSGAAPSYDLYTTPAFARTVLPRTAAGYVYLVRLRRGAAGLSRFDVAATSLRAAGVQGGQNEDETALSVESSIHPQAIGWWILAALAALVGLAVVGQALARQSIVESEDYPTMAAIGANRRQLVTLGMAQKLVVGLVGAAGAVAVATVLSPIAPLGEARIAETSTGIAFDTPVSCSGHSPRWRWCSFLAFGPPCGQRMPCGPTNGRLPPVRPRWWPIWRRWVHRRAR